MRTLVEKIALESNGRHHRCYGEISPEVVLRRIIMQIMWIFNRSLSDQQIVVICQQRTETKVRRTTPSLPFFSFVAIHCSPLIQWEERKGEEQKKLEEFKDSFACIIRLPSNIVFLYSEILPVPTRLLDQATFEQCPL